jgi:hypothetical protein
VTSRSSHWQRKATRTRHCCAKSAALGHLRHWRSCSRSADGARFGKSRDIGAYLGLVPRQDDSGDRSSQLRITKAGDPYLRRLLVGSAQYIGGPFGPDTDLRRHGEKLMQRGGKNGKKRAIVAVARKLAVLLHRLWITGEIYQPLRNSNRQASNESRISWTDEFFALPPVPRRALAAQQQDNNFPREIGCERSNDPFNEPPRSGDCGLVLDPFEIVITRWQHPPFRGTSIGTEPQDRVR